MRSLVLSALRSDRADAVCSTIAYDTLVRAGVKCTSALIHPDGTSGGSEYAECSRGVRIIPDIAEKDIPANAVVCGVDIQGPQIANKCWLRMLTTRS